MFRDLLPDKLYDNWRLGNELKEIAGVLEAALQDQMAKTPLHYSEFTNDNTY